MASRFDLEIELQSSAEEYWKNLKEFPTFFPKALPHLYQSVEVLEGDGKSVGSVLLLTLKLGVAEGSNVTSSKEKVVLMDEETKTLSNEMLEGDIMKICKSFRDVMTVVSKDKGSLLKYSAIYDKANEEAPDPEVMIKDMTIKFYQDLDAYLIKTRN